MIYYKDMVFCIAPCSAECDIKFTPEVHKNAKEWWGKASGDVPIAISDYSDTCFEFKDINTKDNYDKI